MHTSSIETIWQEKDPETQERLGREYRRMLLSALVVAEHFRQEGREIRDIIHYLGCLEKWMVTTFAPGAATDVKKLSDDDERRISQLILGESGKAINDVLLIAASSRTQVLQTLLDQSFRRSITQLPHGVQVRHVDGVMLPPGREIPMANEEDSPWVESKNVIPRLEMLLDVLKNENVDMSSVEVIEGEAPEKSFRLMPYWCIQIPEIGKQVLICEQEKQGTYVIHGTLPLHQLFTLSKDELLEMESLKAEMIAYWSQRSWKTKMSQVLFDDEKLKKMRRGIIEEIQKKYSVQQWIDMGVKEMRSLDIGGKKYLRVASDLGMPIVTGMSEEVNLELAAVIYGENDPVLEPHLKKMRARVEKQHTIGEDIEAWRKEIQGAYSIDQWIALKLSEKLKFNFFGKSLWALAQIFGIKDRNGSDPKKTHEAFLRLTLAIFLDMPEEKKSEIRLKIEALEQVARLKGDPEAIIKSLKERYTSEEWVAMTSETYEKIRIGEMGIDAIGSVFNIEKVSQGQRRKFMQLGACVYGADDKCIKKEMEELDIIEDPEKLKAELRKRYTAEQWVGLSLKEKRAIRIGGLGLEGLGKVLGHKGSPASYMKDHLRIGERVFDPEDVEKYMRAMLNDFAKQEELGDDLQKWREEIKKQYTREQWVSIRGMRRRDVVICGKGVMSLATMFGIQGNALGKSEVFKELADAIFGKEEI